MGEKLSFRGRRQWVSAGLNAGFWIAVATAVVCLIRGLPVIIEGTTLISEMDSKKTGK